MFGFFRSIHHKLDAISAQQETIMAAIDDLNTAEAGLEDVMTAVLTDVQTLSAELQAALNSGNGNDAAISAVAGKLNSLADRARAVLTPPPVPVAEADQSAA